MPWLFYDCDEWPGSLCVPSTEHRGTGPGLLIFVYFVLDSYGVYGFVVFEGCMMIAGSGSVDVWGS